MSELHQAHETPTLKAYFWGFFLSILLTLIAYFVVTEHMFSMPIVYGIIIFVALLQALVQLLLFLHLANDTRPRWKLLTFLFMLMVALIVVFGTIWIMNNLNYNLM